ncbi:MaoC family dehydratase [Halomonadaceae bacterium KBTZ08]
MNQTAHYRFSGPTLLPMYGKALLASTKAGHPSAADLPELSARIDGVRTDTTQLRHYRDVCGFTASSLCPITWPHILAFPLHIRLMTDTSFPLPLMGLVHVRNRINQQRAIHQGEILELQARITNATDTARGIEFDILTEASSAGHLIWTEHSTILYRQPQSGDSGGKKSKDKPEPPQLLTGQARVQAPANIGYRYGRVSGDMNPIHLHPLSAKAFGFPRNIAHGMWSKAHCLALWEQTEGPLEKGNVDIHFKKPFFIPGTGILTWERHGRETPLRLLNSDASAPHLEGTLSRG